MVLYNGGFHQDRRTNLRSIVRNCRRDRRNCWYFSAARVTLRRAIRLSSATRITARFLSCAFLYPHRLRERIVHVRNVRGFVRPFGCRSARFVTAFFNVARGVRLCMGRFLGFRTVLYLAGGFQVLQGVGVVRHVNRKRRLVYYSWEKA